MSNQYEKMIMTDGTTSWKCLQCSAQIRSRNKPNARSHHCLGPVGRNVTPVSRNPQNRSPFIQLEELFGGAGTNHSTPHIGQPIGATAEQSLPQYAPQGQFVQQVPQHPSQEQMFMQQQQTQMQQFMAQQQMQFMEAMKTQQELIKTMMEQNNSQRSDKDDSTRSLIEAFKSHSLENKKVKCPRWSKQESFNVFEERLRYWNNCYKSNTKYLDLIDSLQETQREDEKSRLELEVQNKLLNPQSPDIINEVIEKFRKWFGRPRMDVAFDSWLEVLTLKRGETESIDKFLLRFDTIAAKLQQAAVPLPNVLLSLHLLHSLNVDDMQRRIIISNVSLDRDTILEDMKSAVRVMKSSIVERKVSNTDESSGDTAFYTQFNNRGRNRSKERDHSYRGFSYSRPESKGDRREHYEERRNNCRSCRSGSGTRSRERSQSTERRHSYNDRNHSNSNRRNNSRTYETVNISCEQNIEKYESILMNLSHSLRKLTLDSATTRSCVGKKYLNDMIEAASDEEKKSFKNYSENRSFKFGNGIRFPSKSGITIPIELGKFKYDLHVSIIDANIPLLVGNPDMKRMGLSINFERNKAHISKTNEFFDVKEDGNGLLTLPLNVAPMKRETHEILKLENSSVDEIERKVKKVHEVLCHPREEVLKSFYKDSSDYNIDIRTAVEKVSRECPVCLKYRRTPSKPKVGLPTSTTFNDCVAIDLKDRRNKSSYILYAVDTFSRLTRGKIIRNKEPKTIVKALLDVWILGHGIGPGVPRRFQFDNGTEFNNPEIQELCEKFGIKIQPATTAAHSPFSNGTCEKNHGVVDIMMEKLMEGDPSIKESDALDFALNAKNMETNNKGFSAMQIVYGFNPSLPGLINSTPAGLDDSFINDDIKNHIMRLNMARIAFLEADTDERLKRALASRINAGNHTFFQTGDMVNFKEDGKTKWSGPAKVIGIDGKVIHVKYGNNIRRIHQSKVAKDGFEYQRTPTNNADEDATSKKESEDEYNQQNVTEKSSADNANEDNEESISSTVNNKNSAKVERPKRKASLKRPNSRRRIKFKKMDSAIWREGEVTRAGAQKDEDYMICHILIEGKDIVIIDFDKEEYEWKYCDYVCHICGKTFEKKRGFLRHCSIEHETENHISDTKEKTISFEEEEDDVESKASEESDDIYGEDVLFTEVKENATNREKFQAAKNKELENFECFEAYEEVPEEDQPILGSRFVVTEKPDGSLKARLVVKGFQEEDKQQADSPTASREMFKVFCAVSSNEGWNIEASDVRSAFLQSEVLDRDIFVRPPPEKQRKGYIWHLKKPVYGLNDASRKWFQSTSNFLLSLGMRQSMGDNCLFFYSKNEKLEGLIIIHVDDFLSAGSNIFQKEVMSKLRLKYQFGNVSEKHFVYTGINIQQNEENSKILVDQNSFVENLEIPKYSSENNDEDLEKEDMKLFRQTIGQLNWASSQSRPDVAFDAFSLSTVINRAKIKDAKYATSVLKKLKKRRLFLKFQELGRIEDLHLELFVDAALGNIETEGLTKSMMGYFIVLANEKGDFSPLHWKSKIIDKVAEDIKTAETLALDTALDDAIFLSRILTEMYFGDYKKYKMPIIINEDSKSLVDTLYSTKKVKRKTVRIIISSLQQYMREGTISDIKHVNSKHQLADAFTKQGVYTDRLLQVLEKGSLV